MATRDHIWKHFMNYIIDQTGIQNSSADISIFLEAGVEQKTCFDERLD